MLGKNSREFFKAKIMINSDERTIFKYNNGIQKWMIVIRVPTPGKM